jgi:serpin B
LAREGRCILERMLVWHSSRTPSLAFLGSALSSSWLAAFTLGCSSSSPGGSTSPGTEVRVVDASPATGSDGAMGLGDAGEFAYAPNAASGSWSPPTSVLPPLPALNDAVAASNAFGFDLYGQLMGDGGGGNVLVSPLSASLALTMAYAGAAGQTATEMASVLHANLPDGGSIFDEQNTLDQALVGRGAAAFALAQASDSGPAESDSGPAPVASDYQLQIVNAVWGEQTYPWAPAFLGTLMTSYGSSVYLTDFANAPAQAVVTINDWVSTQTAGTITDLLSPSDVDTSTAMVLVDALHLKFPWATAFDVSQTRTGTFTRADGTTVSPSFMNQTMVLPYADDGQAQIVAIPYASAEALVVVLPHPGVSLASYEAWLVAGGVLPQPTASREVEVSIPKLTLGGTTFPLTPALLALGMQQAFIPRVANFTGMCPPPDGSHLYISFVLQQTTLAMEETGVEASAATAVGVGIWTEGVTSEGPPVFVADRPYFIAIVDVPTGAMLFVGHVEDPTAQ